MKPLEVFDLRADPEEHDDLAAGLDGAEIREMEDRLLGAKLSIDAFWSQHPVPAEPAGRWGCRGPPMGRVRTR